MSTQPPAAPVARNFSAAAFVVSRLALYREIWQILGREWINLTTAATWAGEHIPGTEHGKLNPNLRLTEDQQAAILAELERMDLFEGLEPCRDWCNELLVTGAKYRAMKLQGKMVMGRLLNPNLAQRLSVQRLVGLYGQRPRTDETDGTIQEIYDNLSQAVKEHPWVQEQWDLREADNANEPFGGPFGSEFELGILSLLDAANGDIVLADKWLCSDSPALPDVPAHRYNYLMRLPRRTGTEVVILNAPAVARPGRPSRPTTRTTMNYWLDDFGMQPDTERLVVATVRVHGYRQLATAEARVHEVRPDVSVYGLSQTVDNPAERVKLFPNALGEAIRLLQKADEELRLA